MEDRKPTKVPSPTETLAELRYFTNAIENAAIQAYFGNHNCYAALHNCLSDCLRSISGITVTYLARTDDCPWPLTPDGECKPVDECSV